MFLALGGCFLLFRDQRFLSYAEIEAPTRADYLEAIGLSNLLGSVRCQCVNGAISIGTLVPTVKFGLDSYCGLSSEPAVATDLASQSHTIDSFVSVSYASQSYRACDLTTLNPGDSAAALQDLSLLCGASLAAYVAMLASVDEVCSSVEIGHNNTATNFLNEFLMHQQLVSESQLINEIASRLIAYGGMNSAALVADMQMTMMTDMDQGMVLDAVFGKWVTQMSDHSLFTTAACDQFFMGSGNGTMDRITPLADPISECYEQGYWIGRCCKAAGGCVSAKMPCSREMQVLANRRNQSEYSSLTKAYAQAFVKGMPDDFASMRQVQTSGLLTPEGSQPTVGFYIDDGADWSQIWESYFEHCAPEMCEYTYAQSPWQNFLFIALTLVGGIVTAMKVFGFTALVVVKRTCLKRRNEKTQDADDTIQRDESEAHDEDD